MIRPLARHRIVAVVPIVILGLATLVGGWLNGIDVTGRVIDDFTDDGIGGAGITHGSRSVTADPSGNFTFPSLPRESKIQIDAPGYQRTGAPVAQDEQIRLSPLSFTIQVNEAGNPTKHIASADIRQGTTSLGKTNDGGNTVISPHPGKDAKLLICAAGYDQLEITIKGVVATFELTPGTNACPPLPTPTPSPSPSASPSASPGASPSATPTPSPTASP